jgi:hypothetical protein
MDVFVGDLTDLTEPWLRRCDFLRTGPDTGDGSLGLGNLSSSWSDSFALLRTWLRPGASSVSGVRSWASGEETATSLVLLSTGVSGGGGVTVMASGDVG